MNEKSAGLPKWLLFWVWQALLGEIYPEIRAIALRFDESRNFLIRYYLAREPTEDDFEDLSVVVTNILSNTSSNEDIRSVKKEIVFSQDGLYQLDPLDGFVYARKEVYDV